MTREHTPELDDVVTQGSFGLELIADVYYGGVRLLEGITLDDWYIDGDYDAEIKTTAKVRVLYQGDFAETVTPREATDALAAFGQEIHLFLEVRAGDFIERIRAGVFRIDDVPSGKDRTATRDGRLLTVGSIVELDLVDRTDNVNTLARSLERPQSLTSAWAEIVRLSRMQVTRTVPDVAIPNSIVYARNRLDAVQQLAALLGGRAFALSDGTLGIIPDEMGEPDIVLSTGEPSGTIIDTEYSMSTQAIANVVIGDFEDEQGNGIHAEAWVQNGPLAVDGPFGERVVEYPGDQKQFIRTQAAADTAVRNHLAKVSGRGPKQIPVQLVPDPRIEIGDIATLRRPAPEGDATGRIVKYSLRRKGPMSATVRTLG